MVRWKSSVAIAAVLLCWEGLVVLKVVPPIILASPSQIAEAAFTDWKPFLSASILTAAEIVVSIGIAATLGIVSGCLVGRVRFLAAPSAAMLSSLFAIPLVIVYPIFMTWFGIGPNSKIVFGVLSGYFPIAINTLNGISSVDERYMVLCKSIGATSLQTNLKILLPSSLPSIITGLRIGSGLAVIGVIVAEMLASRGGVGFLISHYRSLFETGHVYFGIIISLVFAYAVNRGISLLEHRMGRRRTSEISSSKATY